jgi:hypothetical protein
MLVLIADYGDDIPEVLIGGFENIAAAEVKIAEIDEADSPELNLDGAELILIDSKTLEYWVYAGLDAGWEKRKVEQ